MDTKNNLEFKIVNWPNDGYKDLNFSLSPECILPFISNQNGNSPKLVSDFTGNISLDLLNDKLKIKGNFNTVIQEYCDKCLEESNIEIKGNFSEILQLVENLDLSKNFEENSLSEVLVKNKTLNLSPLLSEFFWLAWPFSIRCTNNCKGLCPNCGENLNTTPCECIK